MKPSTTQTAEQLLVDILKQLNERQSHHHDLLGHSTGFTELDDKTLGLQDGQLILVAARPSMGKTTFAMNLAEAVLYKSKPVVIFSMELPADAVMLRMLSSFASIDQSHLRLANMSTEEWGKLTSAVSYFNDKPLFINDEGNLSVAEMGTIAQNIAEQQKERLGLIVIDYAQVIRKESEPPLEDEMDNIGKQLKQLAVTANCPVIVLSQLNRSVEMRDNKRPLLSDLVHADALAHHADTALFIYRDAVYNEETPESGTKEKGIAEIIIAKQTHGPLGTVPLLFEGQYTRFRDLTPEYYQGVDFSEL